jgi:hypothetical protein
MFYLPQGTTAQFGRAALARLFARMLLSRTKIRRDGGDAHCVRYCLK